MISIIVSLYDSSGPQVDAGRSEEEVYADVHSILMEFGPKKKTN